MINDDNQNKPLSLDELEALMQQNSPNNEQMVEQPVEPQIDPALQAARDERDRLQKYGMLLRGFQNIVQGTTGHKADMGTADQLMKMGDQQVADYRADQAAKAAGEKAKMESEKHQALMKKFSQDLDKGGLDITDQKQTRDPNSKVSQLAQEFMIKTNPNLNPETIKGMSAHELYTNSKPMQDFLVQKIKADQQAERLRQADERLDIYRDREKGKNIRFKRSQDFKEAEKQEISDKQTEQLAGYDEALMLLQDAQKFKDKVDTGPLTKLSDMARSAVGKGDVQVSDLKMAIGETLAQKVKALSGTAVSDKEREFIESISLPSIKDDDEQFNAKLERAIQTIEKARQNRIESFEKQGKDPSAFKKESKKEAPTGKRVIQNGNIFEIDENGNAKFIGKAE